MLASLSQYFHLLRKDFSFSALAAGLIIALVGMTSSAVIVFQAASASGAGVREASSWLGSLCLLMGLLTVYLSMRYKAPILLAWSTAGAALLVTGANRFPLPELIGAFLFSAVLIFLSGITGLFEKVKKKIPLALASALLAGVLLHFSLDSFAAFKTEPLLIGLMFVSYVLAKKYWPRLTMLIVLIVGVAVSYFSNLLHVEGIRLRWTEFYFVAPSFSIQSLLSIGLPLFIVTMASQNLTGITVMRTYGYQTPASPLIAWTGLANILTAPFGGFTINLAAITAALGMGPEAHPDKSKRYVAGVVSGVLYFVIGIVAGTVTSIFAAFPKELILGVAGLALLGTIASCLQTALSNTEQREAAFITFIVTASNLSLFGIGSAFWGLLVGIATLLIFRAEPHV